MALLATDEAPPGKMLPIVACAEMVTYRFQSWRDSPQGLPYPVTKKHSPIFYLPMAVGIPGGGTPGTLPRWPLFRRWVKRLSQSSRTIMRPTSSSTAHKIHAGRHKSYHPATRKCFPAQATFDQFSGGLGCQLEDAAWASKC